MKLRARAKTGAKARAKVDAKARSRERETKQENSFHRFRPFHQARRRNILTTINDQLGLCSFGRQCTEKYKELGNRQCLETTEGKTLQSSVLCQKVGNSSRTNSDLGNNVTCFRSSKQEVE